MIGRIYRRINEAYTVLRDDRKRAQYLADVTGPDRAQEAPLHRGRGGGGARTSRSASSRSSSGQTPNGRKFYAAALVEIAGRALGGGRAGPQEGAHVRARQRSASRSSSLRAGRAEEDRPKRRLPDQVGSPCSSTRPCSPSSPSSASLGALAGLLRPLFLFAGAALGWLAARHLSAPVGRLLATVLPASAARPVAAVLLFVVVTVVDRLRGPDACRATGKGRGVRSTGPPGRCWPVWPRRRPHGSGSPWRKRWRPPCPTAGRRRWGGATSPAWCGRTTCSETGAAAPRWGSPRSSQAADGPGSVREARERPRPPGAGRRPARPRSDRRGPGRRARRDLPVAGGPSPALRPRLPGAAGGGAGAAGPAAGRSDGRESPTCPSASPCRRRAWRPDPGWRFSWAFFRFA